MAWDPAQYERYKADRTKPFTDLLALVKPKAGMRVVDLGCGTGELTRRLHEHLRARETVGLDGSEAMLARSGAFAAPGLRVERRTIQAFASAPNGPWDLIFSNAALHWVGDHPALLGRLAAALSPGGQLAIQVPVSFNDEAHVVAEELARQPPFADLLRGFIGYPHPLEPDEYQMLLRELGFAQALVEVRDYVSRLGSRDEVVEWYRGSLLTPYEERLGGQFSRFLDAYRERLVPRLPDERPFFFHLPRLLLWARR